MVGECRRGGTMARLGRSDAAVFLDSVDRVMMMLRTGDSGSVMVSVSVGSVMSWALGFGAQWMMGWAPVVCGCARELAHPGRPGTRRQGARQVARSLWRSFVAKFR